MVVLSVLGCLAAAVLCGLWFCLADVLCVLDWLGLFGGVGGCLFVLVVVVVWVLY